MLAHDENSKFFIFHSKIANHILIPENYEIYVFSFDHNLSKQQKKIGVIVQWSTSNKYVKMKKERSCRRALRSIITVFLPAADE